MGVSPSEILDTLKFVHLKNDVMCHEAESQYSIDMGAPFQASDVFVTAQMLGRYATGTGSASEKLIVKEALEIHEFYRLALKGVIIYLEKYGPEELDKFLDEERVNAEADEFCRKICYSTV